MKNIKSQLKMSNKLSRTTESFLDSILRRDVEKVREYLQLFIIQFELYREMIGDYDEG